MSLLIAKISLYKCPLVTFNSISYITMSHSPTDRALKKLHLFGDVVVSIIIDNNETIWFKAVDVATALDMENPRSSVSNNMDKTYCLTYEQLKLGEHRDPKIHPRTTFVNETGLNMYLLRSRKPKAYAFCQWVCGEVLPSIRKTNRYEVDGANNPYRDMNKYLMERVSTLENDMRTSEARHTEERDRLMKYVEQVFTMKPTCVPQLENDLKKEFLVIYKKYKGETDDEFPYYACRVQLDSLERRKLELMKTYPELTTLLRLPNPNSVNFYNFILERYPEFVSRGKKGDGNSFRSSFDDAGLKLLLENIYRQQFGVDVTDSNK